MKKTRLLKTYVNSAFKIACIQVFLICTVIPLVFAKEHQEKLKDDKKITGTIKDAKGEGIPGVIVQLKGTSKGTATDFDGNFSIDVPNDSSVLVVSLIGYTTQEIIVGSQTSISTTLLEDVKTMDEVVIVGYGETKKETMTGAVSTVDSKVLKDRGILSNPLAALQGQVPGVVVTRQGAQTGREGWSIQVRGASSANNAEPLYVVDGVPYSSADGLNSLNPADIENISVLKDASAAIYGSRAAGGVVLITTKRAKSGKPTIQYSSNISLKKLGLNPELASRNQWAQMYKDALANDGNTTSPWETMANYMLNPPVGNYATQAQLAAGFNGSFTDVKDFTFFDQTMKDILWGNAVSNTHSLSMSGRGEKNGYRVSLGYTNDGSLLQWGTNYSKRYNARLSYDYQPIEKLKLETTLSFERQDITEPTLMGNVTDAYSQPGLAAEALNGKPYGWGTQHPANQIAKLGGNADQSDTRINTAIKLSYDITKELQLVATAGYNYWNTDFTSQQNPITWYDYTGTSAYTNKFPTRSLYVRQNIRDAYYNINAYLQYTKTFAKNHNVKLMAGAQYERDEYAMFYAQTYDLASLEVPSLGLTTGDPTTKSSGEAKSHWAIGSYFSRLNYDYKGKYLLEANARFDGSSRFDAANRWKFFYGVSGGWRISEENFMKDLKFIDNLKLRASYGVVGNQSGIGLYDFIQTLVMKYPGLTNTAINDYPLLGASPVIRVSPTTTLVSLNRTWEEVHSSNIGVDFGFLNSRLTGSFDYYLKYNNNMLINVAYPAVLGANAPTSNSGELKTWGWEATLGWRDKVGGVTYYVRGNLSDNQNELVNYGGTSIMTMGYSDGTWQPNTGSAHPFVQGYPLYSYFGYEYAGRIQTQQQLTEYKAMTGVPSTVRIGDNMYKDLNGDGKIDNVNDIAYLGTNMPRYTFGINLGMQWKGFDVAVILQGVGKRTIIREGYLSGAGLSTYLSQAAVFYGNTWTPTNTNAEYPELSFTNAAYNYQASDWKAQDGSYIRLKNLVVGYTIPQRLVSRFKIDRLRVYFSGNDLCELTNLKDGWDPEAQQNPTNGNRFPFYRYYTMGLDLTF